MKKHDIKKRLDVLKKTFIKLLSVCTIKNVGESLAFNFEGSTKCVSLKNQPCIARPILANKNSNKTFFVRLMLALINMVKVVVLLMIHLLCSK